MKIFPDFWANPLARHEVVEAPIGENCFACHKPIKAGDKGVVMPHVAGFPTPQEYEEPWHRECLFESLGIA